MRSFVIGRVASLPVLALASVALVLPLASQAATGNTTAPGPPRVSTGGVSHVSGTSAVLEGSVNPRTLATTYYFQYGPTTAYGAQTTPASLPAGTTLVKVQQAVTGLLPGYHYRLVAANANGKKLGHDRTFSTQSSKKPSFALPKTFQATPLGGVFLLSGTLTGTGNANRAVVLTASPYPYSAPYADVGSPILTTADGRFSFRVANLTTSTKFRVSTVGTTPLRSLIVPARVSVRVVLKVRSSSRRGLVRLYGTVTPAEVGAHVFFQLEKPPKTEESVKTGEKPAKLENPAKGKGKSERSKEKKEKGPTFLTKFSTVVKRGTKAISRFSAVVDVQDGGRYRAFVEVPAGALVSGHSVGIVVHAAPSAAKKKKKKKK